MQQTHHWAAGALGLRNRRMISLLTCTIVWPAQRPTWKSGDEEWAREDEYRAAGPW
jgi:hypothetical protein